ncbi:MAG: lyase family protein [Pseudomonadota bacterium]
MSVPASPPCGPPLGLAGALLADEEVAALLAPGAEIEAMLAFELVLARAQHAVGEIDAAALAAIATAAVPGTLDPDDLAAGLCRDGVAVPAMVRQVRAAIGAPHAGAFHRGATSQDVIDTALMLRLKPLVAILCGRLCTLVRALEGLAARDGAAKVMARTRHQDALPFTLADRIATWTAPLETLCAARPMHFPLQLGGAIGLRARAYGPHHAEIAAAMAGALGLAEPGRAWHTDRQPIGAVVHWIAALATVLGKIGQDIALMTQTPVAEIRAPGGGSSAMAHKHNPVGAELLVTLARHVGGHAAMMQAAALHENERSGIAWTQEWLVLPPLAVGCGAALRHAQALVAGLDVEADAAAMADQG